jgi:hypothetical protein
VKIDSDKAVRGLFGVDGMTREMYKTFRDCIFFDTTFCVNRYNMSFEPIVGVNNHTQSILLGCALLPNQTTKSFVWVFRTLKEAMGGLEPRNIMTDQDKAMNSAIALVFPDAVHRCCKFHVVSKACEKLGWLINSSDEFANKFDYALIILKHQKNLSSCGIAWRRVTTCTTMKHSRTCQLLGQCGRQHTSGNHSSLSQALLEG